jgi:hypothetical protein
MRLFFFVPFLLFYHLSDAQKNGIKNNVKIDTAGKVNIKGSTVTILKADTVFIGTLIINQSVKTRIYFAGSTREMDTSGLYITKYKFVPVDNPGQFFVKLHFIFNKPFIPNGLIDFIVTDEAGVIPYHYDWNATFTDLNIRATLTGEVFWIRVISKEILSADIEGIDGRLN